MRWAGWSSLLAVAILAGCLTPSNATPPPASSAAIVQQTVALQDCLQGGPPECFESSVAAGPDGRIYVVNGVGPEGSRSLDGGATWMPMTIPIPSPYDTAGLQDLDALVRTAPDGSVVYSGILAKSAQAGPLGVPIGLLAVHVAVSHDEGRTWPVDTILTVDSQHDTLVADRQWTAVGPDGSYYVTFNECKAAFASALIASQASLADIGRCNVMVSRSDDRGATWGPFVQATDPGGGGNAGQLVFDGDGLLIPCAYVRTGASTYALDVLRSSDRGATWRMETILQDLPNAAYGGGFLSVAAGRNGTEAFGWNDLARGELVATRPAGSTTWSTPVVWSATGETTTNAPTLLATEGGWAVSYITNASRNGTDVLDYHLALGDDRGPRQRIDLGSEHTFAEGPPNSDFATLARAPDGRYLVTQNTSQLPRDPHRVTVDLVTVGDGGR